MTLFTILQALRGATPDELAEFAILMQRGMNCWRAKTEARVIEMADKPYSPVKASMPLVEGEIVYWGAYGKDDGKLVNCHMGMIAKPDAHGRVTPEMVPLEVAGFMISDATEDDELAIERSTGRIYR